MSTDEPGSAAERRVRAAVGQDVLRVLEDGLSTNDLTTLFLSVAARRASAVPVTRLTSAFAGRFVRAVCHRSAPHHRS